MICMWMTHVSGSRCFSLSCFNVISLFSKSCFLTTELRLCSQFMHLNIIIAVPFIAFTYFPLGRLICSSTSNFSGAYFLIVSNGIDWGVLFDFLVLPSHSSISRGWRRRLSISAVIMGFCTYLYAPSVCPVSFQPDGEPRLISLTCHALFHCCDYHHSGIWRCFHLSDQEKLYLHFPSLTSKVIVAFLILFSLAYVPGHCQNVVDTIQGIRLRSLAKEA
jgi:hypothetical protein